MEGSEIQMFIDNQVELNLMIADLINFISNYSFAIITLIMIVIFVIPFLIYKN